MPGPAHSAASTLRSSHPRHAQRRRPWRVCGAHTAVSGGDASARRRDVHGDCERCGREQAADRPPRVVVCWPCNLVPIPCTCTCACASRPMRMHSRPARRCTCRGGHDRAPSSLAGQGLARGRHRHPLHLTHAHHASGLQAVNTQPGRAAVAFADCDGRTVKAFADCEGRTMAGCVDTFSRAYSRWRVYSTQGTCDDDAIWLHV